MNRHFDPDDPRLTAYVLGELDEADRAEIEAELERNEAARDAVAEIRVMADMLTRELQSEPGESLTPEQRAAVLEGRRPAASRRFGRYFALVTSAAACLALFAGVAYMSYTQHRSAQSEPAMLAKGEREETVAESVQRGIILGERAGGHGLIPILSSAVSGEKVAETDAVDAAPFNDRAGAELSGKVATGPADEFSRDALDLQIEDAGQQLAVDADGDSFGLLSVSPPADAETPEPEDFRASIAANEPGFAAGLPQPKLGPKPAPPPSTTVTSARMGARGAVPSTEPAARISSRRAGMTAGVAGESTQLGVEADFKASIEEDQLDRLQSLGYLDGSSSGGGMMGGMADVGGFGGGAAGISNGDGSVLGDVPVTGSLFRGRTQLARGDEEMLREGLYEIPPDRPVRRGPAEGRGTETYEFIVDNPFRKVADAALSTFSIDVDTASYTNIRRFLNGGQLPPKPAVRIEEMVNYFEYDYPQPEGKEPFSVNVEVAACPWQPEHELVRIGLKGKDVPMDDRPVANLVFLLDVSGSMGDDNKLPLLKKAMGLLVGKLDDTDRVAIVTYSNNARITLESTSAKKQQTIYRAIAGLNAGGGTNGASGIEVAYDVAADNLVENGINRVILATDGDFNVGVTDRSDLFDLIQDRAKTGVFLTVLGFGTGNLKDANLEGLADKGNGHYAYIDSFNEARKVLMEQVGSTFFTIAKDVKIQVEFNPGRVDAYRLIGYENRVMADRDFTDDRKDAGEIGAGHTVTALYEIVQKGRGGVVPGVDTLKYQKPPETPENVVDSSDLMTVKLRYKLPDENTSSPFEVAVADSETSIERASADLKFAAAVAGFGMLLRDSDYMGDTTYDLVLDLARAGKGSDDDGYRAEFVNMVKTAQALQTN